MQSCAMMLDCASSKRNNHLKVNVPVSTVCTCSVAVRLAEMAPSTAPRACERKLRGS